MRPESRESDTSPNHRIFVSGHLSSSGREIAKGTFEAAGIYWGTIDVALFSLVYSRLKEETERLKMENEDLRQQLKTAQSCQSDPEPVIELRDISHEQAKREIAAYFKENDGREIWPDEIAEQLRIDIELVLDVCEELADEEKIAPL